MHASFPCVHMTVLDSARFDARWMPMSEENEPCPEDSQEAGDDRSAWIAERVSILLQEKGIAPRQQAAFLAELCALSLSQARRKLRGAMWAFAEILTIAQHFEISIDQWFLAKDTSHPAIDSSGDLPPHSLPLQDAQMLFASHRIGCQVRLGPQCIAAPEADALITGQFAGEWLVGTPDTLPLPDAEGPLFYADRVELQPAATRQRIRIAIRMRWRRFGNAVRLVQRGRLRGPCLYHQRTAGRIRTRRICSLYRRLHVVGR